MHIRDHYQTLDAEQRAKLATALQTSPAYLMQLAYGHRRPSLQLAIAIERETAGQVTARELRPDLGAQIFGALPKLKRNGKAS